MSQKSSLLTDWYNQNTDGALISLYSHYNRNRTVTVFENYQRLLMSIFQNHLRLLTVVTTNWPPRPFEATIAITRLLKAVVLYLTSEAVWGRIFRSELRGLNFDLRGRRLATFSVIFQLLCHREATSSRESSTSWKQQGESLMRSLVM